MNLAIIIADGHKPEFEHNDNYLLSTNILAIVSARRL